MENGEINALYSDHPAVVLDLSANGIGMVRSLKQKGIQVYAYDTTFNYKTGRTRYAQCGECPHPIFEETKLLDFMLDLGKKFSKKAVLYAGSDDFVYFISKYRCELTDHFIFLLPEHTLIEAVLDKRLTYELAKLHGIPCPETYIIEHDEQIDYIIHKLNFPCILKPAFSADYRKRLNKKAIIVEDANQLRKDYPIYSQFGEIIIQELIPGDDSCVYEVATFFDEKMSLKGLLTVQKLHQYPPTFGSGTLVISKREPDLVKIGVSFLGALNFFGLAHAEFKKDPRDGKFKFIEINPRPSLSHSIGAPSGIDFPILYYLSLTGQEITPKLEQIDGIKWLLLVRDILGFRQKHKYGELSLFEWLKHLSGKKEFALFKWDDPMPFIRKLMVDVRSVWKQKNSK